MWTAARKSWMRREEGWKREGTGKSMLILEIIPSASCASAMSNKSWLTRPSYTGVGCWIRKWIGLYASFVPAAVNRERNRVENRESAQFHSIANTKHDVWPSTSCCSLLLCAWSVNSVSNFEFRIWWWQRWINKQALTNFCRAASLILLGYYGESFWTFSAR